MTTDLHHPAALLDGHGRDTRTLPHAMQVRNPVTGRLSDAIRVVDTNDVISAGHKMGEVGAEAAPIASPSGAPDGE
ncbi:hypothetical protein [Sphaerisporangium aureirubrum]|uniref:Uncharacterized protein n=1 Tax=Sphaerisporangium aureirubrum TaxID=1544736 RepID=A0ABW1NDI0_9ACTN